MAVGASFMSGLAGACALTVAHETLRHTVPGAPRMDVLGSRGLKKVLGAAGFEAPRGQALFEATLAGDILSNAAALSLVGSGKGAVLRGTLVGALLGIGAVVLPGPIGLGKPPGLKTPRTELLTIAVYTLGGMVAGLAASRSGR
jgi:hypothetical protein